MPRPTRARGFNFANIRGHPPEEASQLQTVPPAQFRGAGVIQRFMGIEAEMSIPTWMPGPMANSDQMVQSFLTGGMQEGTPLQAPAGGFSIETDHDRMKTEIENQRANFARPLAGMPLNPRNAGFLVGNLEYKTDPRCDEETAAGRLALRNSTTLMVADMNARWINRFAPAAAPIAANGIVGAPALADYVAFGVAHAIGVPAMTLAHQQLTNRMSRNLYVQVTAGITPRRIVRHLERARRDRDVLSATTTAAPNLVMDLLTTGAVSAARQALNNTPGLARAVRRSTSLRGVLSLVISYLYGNYLVRGANLTDMKNIAAFLSKAPLNQVLLELDVAKRPDLWAAPTRNALIAQIRTIVVARVGQPDVLPFWNVGGGTHDNGALGPWRTQWLPEILSGTEDSFSAAALAGRVFDPADHARSKAITSGGAVAGGPFGLPGGGPLDRPAARQAPNPVRSGAIPLEFRRIETSPDPNNLLPLVNHMIRYVRGVNR